MKSGKIKPIALLTLHRDKHLPAVATADEQGLTGFEQPNYFGFVAPAGKNPAILEKVYAAIAKVAKYPETLKFEAEVNVIVANKPAELSKYVATEVARGTRLVADEDLKLD